MNNGSYLNSGADSFIANYSTFLTHVVNNSNFYAGNITMGDYEGDKTIYFYEDSNPTGEYLMWDDSNDYFYLSDQLYVASFQTGGASIMSQISSTADIYTTGAGDDLWLGDTTQGDAGFQAYADGSLIIADKKYNVSTTGNLTAKTDVCILGGNCLANMVGGTDSFSANYSTFLTHVVNNSNTFFRKCNSWNL